MSSKLLKNYLPEIFALGFVRSKPAMVTVNLTHRCNQHCVYCEIGSTPASSVKDKLSVDDLKWVIDQMYEQKIPKISLCGGEPFLFDGIVGLVDYAGERKIHCSITTNGMTAYKLTDQELQTLKRCKTEVNISIDSFQDDINSLTRGSTVALSNALKSIGKFREKEIPVTVLTVISKYNFQDLSGFFAEACERGIKQVLFQPVIYYSNYPDRPTVENKSQFNVGMDQIDRLMEELSNILNFEKTHPIKTNVYRIFPWIKYYLKTAADQNGHWFFHDVLPKFYCREIYAIIDIAYDGGIQPCGLRPASISILNNRQSGLPGLWSEATEKIKNDLDNEKYYDCCNGCCHHFSRNMLASLAKYPIQNRMALIHMIPLMISRIFWRIMKKFSS